MIAGGFILAYNTGSRADDRTTLAHSSQFASSARITIGMHALRPGDPDVSMKFLGQAAHAARSPDDHLRYSAVLSEVRGRSVARNYLLSLPDTYPDIDAFRRMTSDTAPLESDRNRLRRFGPIVRFLDSEDATVTALRATYAVETLSVFGLVATLAVLAIAGALLHIAWPIARWKGRLPDRYDAGRPPERVAGLAAVAGYFVVLSMLAVFSRLTDHRFGYAPYLLIGFPIAIPFLAMPAREARMILGLHCGRGLLREAAIGVLVFITALPLMALGAGAAFLIIKATHATGAHPIVGILQSASGRQYLAIVVIGGAVAPLCEELVFRGALLHYARGRIGRIPAAATTGLLFAAIHPQGPIALPALWLLGFHFGLARQWRGTVIGTTIAHGLINAIAFLAFRLMMG